MNRLFTFGCSFTQYHWPTWAHIISKGFDQFRNYGHPGAGNSYIFSSLMESIKRDNITKDDTVIIMWTTVAREDRWTKDRRWICPGSIYNQDEYDDNFVKKFADPTGYVIRDIAHITACKKILESIGCEWKFLSMVPIQYYDDSVYASETIEIDQAIKDLYSEELSSIESSIYEVVFDCKWWSRDELKPNLPDDHPTPVEHLMYIDQVIPQFTVKQGVRDLVNFIDQDIKLDKPFDWSVWGDQGQVARIIK